MRPFTTISEADEGYEARPAPRILDGVSAEVGTGVFLRSARFAGLFFGTALGRSPRLPVSRFYWQAEPPVVVDFLREIRYGQAEVDMKRAHFDERGIRYVLAADEWDGEAVLAALPTPPVGEALPGNLPITAPRRK